MKILIVAGPFISLREPYNGGTEAFIVELANELVRLGHTVDVIAKDADEKNLFQVIEFLESPFSMKDDSYRLSGMARTATLSDATVWTIRR